MHRNDTRRLSGTTLLPVTSTGMPTSLAHPRTSLRREIMRLIQPYAYAEKDDIPFTTPELIVTALAGSSELGLRKRMILSWITRHLKAYWKIASLVLILHDHIPTGVGGHEV